MNVSCTFLLWISLVCFRATPRSVKCYFHLCSGRRITSCTQGTMLCWGLGPGFLYVMHALQLPIPLFYLSNPFSCLFVCLFSQGVGESSQVMLRCLRDPSGGSFVSGWEVQCKCLKMTWCSWSNVLGHPICLKLYFILCLLKNILLQYSLQLCWSNLFSLAVLSQTLKCIL